MLHAARSLNGMVVSPHHLASQAGLEVLREGGDAIEAMVATAAAIAVVYPHMNSIGGDGFWLIAEPGKPPVAIDACGAAAAAATPDLYRANGLTSVPWRGPLAANTVAGTLSGWNAALEISRSWGSRLPLARLVADAIRTKQQTHHEMQLTGDSSARLGWGGFLKRRSRALKRLYRRPFDASRPGSSPRLARLNPILLFSAAFYHL